METVAVVIAWVILIFMSMIIAPFFTISAIFFYADMPIISLIFLIFGIINLARRIIRVIDSF